MRVALSLIFFTVLGLSLIFSCATPAQVAGVSSDFEACPVDPERGGLQCANHEKAKDHFVEFKNAGQYTCFSPEDLKQLLQR